jgi:hypothetical protein
VLQLAFVYKCFGLCAVEGDLEDTAVTSNGRGEVDYTSFVITPEMANELTQIAQTGTVTGDWHKLVHVFAAKICQVGRSSESSRLSESQAFKKILTADDIKLPVLSLFVGIKQ